VFRAPIALAARALVLAPSLPRKDERVWLVSSLVEGTELVHPARVFYAADNLLTYQFDSADLQLRATSGAPIVNARGQLIALNLGGRPIQGVLRGFGVPAPSIKKALGEALGGERTGIIDGASNTVVARRSVVC
jgi:hypothetical protein